MWLKFLASLFVTVFTSLIGVIAWKTSFQTALDDLNIESNRKVVQVVDQFKGQLSTARFLPTFLARNNEIVGGLETGSVGHRTIEYLERARDLSGAHEIRLLDATGYQLYSTSGQTDNTNRYDLNYFSRAMDGALGIEVRHSELNADRTLVFARSIMGADRTQIGAVVLDVKVDVLETEFRARPETIVFLDESNTVVFSNRSKLLFKKLNISNDNAAFSEPENRSSIDTDAQISVTESKRGAVTIWHANPNIPLSDSNLIVKRSILPIGLEAVLLTDITPALLYAKKMTYLMVSLLILGLVTAYALVQRRRYFMERIAVKQASIKELDRRVALRSIELEQAQNELVQTAKLSALGKMSVGISHELNQPISSIQNFSVNAKRLLEKRRIDESVENLTEIEKQTERMSRIIRNLRDFSRKDDIASGPVDMGKVWAQVGRMMEQRMNQENVVLCRGNVDQSIMVVGGEIRLQQVLINIISNAIDAMNVQSKKRILLNVERLGRLVKITIEDNGPGLSEPDRVFEPFYTTKTGSSDDGLGLGLSIAYGFVESFGGSLNASNCKSGGALFTLTLPAYVQES